VTIKREEETIREKKKGGGGGGKALGEKGNVTVYQRERT